MELLTVRAGNVIHGVPLEDVEAIIDSWALTRLPLLPPGFAGVAGVRGDVVPVVDLTRLLGAGLESPRRTMLVLRRPDRPAVALLVDRVETLEIVGAIEPVAGQPPWIAGTSGDVSVIDSGGLLRESPGKLTFRNST